MNKAAKRYAWAVIAIGALLLPGCVLRYIQDFPLADPWTEVPQMLCLIILCAVCRSAPIFINEHHAIDVSILAILTAVLLRGPYAGVMVFLLSSPFVIDIDTQTGERWHIFNMPPFKTAFNHANLLVSILMPGLILRIIGHVPGDIALPYVLFPMLIFSSLSFLLNSVILLGLFLCDRQITWRDAKDIVTGLVPNVLAAMPLGLFTCYVFAQPNGYWLALIMLLPLMLARHAWKLYLDSRTQHYKLITAFVASVEARDKYTEGHSRRVNHYCELLAQHMHLRAKTAETLRVASLLHDIGKLGIEDAILLKPDRLTDEEFTRIQAHPSIGVSILEQVGFPSAVTEMILHHHERYDGCGYPEHLKSPELSLGAQIIAVADAFDAMTSDRPYRKGLPFEEAFKRLDAGKGTQFNPVIVDHMLSLGAEHALDGEDTKAIA